MDWLYILLLINAMIGISWLEYAFYKTRVLFDGNEERDRKYACFRRLDLQYWKRWRLYPIAATLLVPRFFGIILIMCIMLPVFIILGIG